MPIIQSTLCHLLRTRNQGRVAIVKVGEAQAEALLVQYANGIRLLESDCKVDQAFELVSEADDYTMSRPASK